MKEIGIKLHEARESNGVEMSEVADDLKMSESQIKNIEEGNIKAFKDVFYLKYFIREYAKYLGLDSEKLVDEFNDFLFDYTSKIPVDEIEKAKKEDKKKQVPKKIISPYTMQKKKKFNLPSKYIYLTIAVSALVIIYFLVSMYREENFKDTAVLYNIELKGV